MNDFTKNKLINSLIDVVERFYELKDRQKIEESLRLKGFCEGISYTLIELGALDKKEAKKIMSGLGVRREVKINEVLLKAQLDLDETQELKLDKDNEPNTTAKIDDDVDLRLKNMHHSFVSFDRKSEDDLDLPTYLRKDRY